MSVQPVGDHAQGKRGGVTGRPGHRGHPRVRAVPIDHVERGSHTPAILLSLNDGPENRDIPLPGLHLPARH